MFGSFVCELVPSVSLQPVRRLVSIVLCKYWGDAIEKYAHRHDNPTRSFQNRCRTNSSVNVSPSAFKENVVSRPVFRRAKQESVRHWHDYHVFETRKPKHATRMPFCLTSYKLGRGRHPRSEGIINEEEYKLSATGRTNQISTSSPEVAKNDSSRTPMTRLRLPLCSYNAHQQCLPAVPPL